MLGKRLIALSCLNEFSNLAIRVIKVAENPGLSRAGVHAGRIQTLCHPFVAECAFDRCADHIIRVPLFLEWRQFPLLIKPLFKGLLMELEAVLIGTGSVAGPASDAFVLIHQYDALFGGVGGLGGTDPFTMGVLTVVADERDI